MNPLLRPSALFVAALLVSCGGTEEAPQDERRPDVILFVIDTLRKDHLSCYGYERPTSPTVDRLAREGALFLDPVAQSSWTRPSMVSMLHGRYVTESRDMFFEDAPTLAEQFEEAGYRTLGVVGNILLSAENGFDRGFQHYDARRNEEPSRAKGGSTRQLETLARDLWPQLERALEPEDGGERPPLFVYVHAMDPHNPYVPHPQYDGDLAVGGARPSEEWHHEVFAQGGGPAPEADPEWRKAWKRLQIARGRYDQEIRYTDGVLDSMLERFRGYGSSTGPCSPSSPTTARCCTTTPSSGAPRSSPDPPRTSTSTRSTGTSCSSPWSERRSSSGARACPRGPSSESRWRTSTSSRP